MHVCMFKYLYICIHTHTEFAYLFFSLFMYEDTDASSSKHTSEYISHMETYAKILMARTRAAKAY